jgi:hypothetical protein
MARLSTPFSPKSDPFHDPTRRLVLRISEGGNPLYGIASEQILDQELDRFGGASFSARTDMRDPKSYLWIREISIRDCEHRVAHIAHHLLVRPGLDEQERAVSREESCLVIGFPQEGHMVHLESLEGPP